MGMFFTQDNKPYFGVDREHAYEIKTDESYGLKVVVAAKPTSLAPNKFYLLGVVTSAVKITRLSSYSREYLETYAGEFTIGEGGSVEFPSSIKWTGEPNFSEVGYTYQFEIRNGIGHFIKVK